MTATKKKPGRKVSNESAHIIKEDIIDDEVGPRFKDKHRWTPEDDDLLLDMYLKGNADDTKRLALGRSWKGFGRRIWALTTRCNGQDGQLTYQPRCRRDRAGTKLTRQDLQTLRRAHSEKGLRFGGCHPDHLAKVLARTPDEVRTMIQRFDDSARGMMALARAETRAEWAERIIAEIVKLLKELAR